MKALRLVGLLVLFLGLSVFSAPCHAKPVQLLDYDAQTFFENYKLACENYEPYFNDALAGGNLTYQGETSLYKKYMFWTNNDVFVTIYENKAGCVSCLDVRKDMSDKRQIRKISNVMAAIEYVLGLDRVERVSLSNSFQGKTSSWTGTMAKIEDKSSVYSKVNQRHIHLLFSTVVTVNNPDCTIQYFLSADDEE